MGRRSPLMLLGLLVLAIVVGLAGGVGWTYWQIHLKPKPPRLSVEERAKLHPLTREGYEAIFAGDHERAYKLLLPRAEAGDAEAQFLVGRLIEDRRTNSDPSESVGWYERAAKSRHGGALNALAIINRKGRYTERNIDQAIELYKMAINHGSSAAAYNLGDLYSRGTDVPLNYQAAAHYFRIAHDRGNCFGSTQLGLQYRMGYGVKQDYFKAYQFYVAAKDLGCDYWWSRLFLRFTIFEP